MIFFLILHFVCGRAEDDEEGTLVVRAYFMNMDVPLLANQGHSRFVETRTSNRTERGTMSLAFCLASGLAPRRWPVKPCARRLPA